MDFNEIHHDAVKEQQLLKKLRPGERRNSGESVLASSLKERLAAEFENGDAKRRLRLVLSEVLNIINQVCVNVVGRVTIIGVGWNYEHCLC